MTGAAAAEADIRARLADLIEDDDPDDVVFVVRMVHSFVDRAPGLLTAVATALAADDPDAIVGSAHALKGAASNVGATGVARLAAELESGARAGDLAPVRGHLARLDAELVAAARHLEAVAASL